MVRQARDGRKLARRLFVFLFVVFGITFQVSALELKIVPDISGGSARASLAQLRVA